MPKKKIIQDMVPARKSSLMAAVPLSVKIEKMDRLERIEKIERAPIKRAGKKVVLEREEKGIDDPIDVPESAWKAADLKAIDDLKFFNSEKAARMAKLPESIKSPIHTHSPKASSSKRGRSRHRNHLLVVITLIISVAVIAVAISFVYAKATVVIVPKIEKITIKNNFTACAGTPCSASSSLAYQILQIPTVELHQTVPSTMSATGQTKAQGTIILYNNFSTTTRTIVATTRLTNSTGLIYRTTHTVIIPGMSKDKSGATTTGSIAVGIIADAAGSQYNISSTDSDRDLSIVAYQGTNKYTTIYAQLIPKSAVSGGSSGQMITIASTTLNTAYTTLKNNLAAQLIAQSASLVPQGYVMYDNAYSIVYKPIMASTSNAGISDIGMQATFYGIMFKINDLVQTLGSSTIPKTSIASDFPNQSFTTENLQSLTFAFSKTPTVPATSTPLMFSLTGAFTVIGTFPSADIAKQLAGKNISDSQPIFAHYGTIASAHAIITPFWRHSFPNSPDKITISIQQ